jgi:hypothetical protein
MQKKIYFQTPQEVAAGEYLAAFIKHLFNKGKSGIEIARTLDISLVLLERLIYDDAMLAELQKRSDDIIWPVIKNTPDKKELLKKLDEMEIAWHESYGNKYYDKSKRFTTIGPWQRNHNFQNAVQYHYHYKKNYSEDDFDVIATLSTGVNLPEQKDKFTDRDLSPQYKLRIVQDLSDGWLLQDISEKYNCSVLAVTQVAAEHGLVLPITDESVANRIGQAIKEGHNLEQLTKRFKNVDLEKIKELIKVHRILPASE